MPPLAKRIRKYLSTMNEASMVITPVATMTETTARETETATIHTVSPPPSPALPEGD